MKYLIWFCIAIVVYKFVSNFINYIQAGYYINKHIEFLADKNGANFEMCHYPIIRLVKKAGITSTNLPYAEPVGYGQLATGFCNVLDNIACRRQDFVVMLQQVLYKAKGTFRTRIFETFSPRYWIDAIIFLPKHLFEYLGLNTDSIFSKLLHLVWWIIAPLAVVFRDNLYELVIELINNIK